MTTRRNIPPEKHPLKRNEESSSAAGSDITPAVPPSVIIKLLGFTLAMVAAPIGTYYATVETVFKGNATYAGATAAVMANVVLIGYVIEAVREDKGDQQQQKKTM